MVRQCMSMDEDFDVDFSDDFLREVDEAEAAASLQHDTRRRSCLKSSPSGAARAHDLVSTSGPTQMGEPDEPRKCGDGRVCNERNPGCGRCSEASEANAGYPTGDTAHEDGETTTYRWEVETISVRDFKTGAEEVVGQGELMVTAQEQVDGALVILSAVVKAAGGARAMKIPREAITFLTHGADRTPTTTSASGGTVADDSPTLLLGLGIGCTIIMSGVHRTPSGGESSDCLSSKLDPIHGEQQEQAFHDVNCNAYSASPLSATPERRQLASVDFQTPHKGAPGTSEEPSAGIRNLSAPDRLSKKKISDPILALLVDASVQSVDSVGALRSPSFRSTEEQPVVLHPGPPARAGRLDSADREIQMSHAAVESSGKWQLQGDADAGASPEMPTLRNSERVDEATHGGCENGAIKSTMASKEEEDVPDDEWRRPLMISPPNRSRASAGRRRPNIRRPPQDELVVLALDDPGSNVEYGMEGQRRAGQGRKRPRIDGKDSGGGRSQETPPPMPTRVNRQSNTSWAALRRTLHERYRECLENGAAQASAAEASRRARFGDSANARGGYGKLLSPGLRVFWRQEQAFAYVDEVGARLPHHEAARYKVLSFETSSTGSRKFLVCDFWRFEEQYLWVARPDSDILRQVSEKPRASQHDQQSRDCGTPISDPNTHATTPQISGALENDERAGCVKPLVSRAAAPWPLQHVYEIIREGMPCRMYFDLEFTRACNVGLDGEALVRAWINVVAGKLQQDFGISVGKTDFLDLDSSTAKKFSRHLIVHLPGDQLFADNSHVGRFVNTLAADLEIFKPPPAAAGSCPPLSAMSGPIPTPSPGDIPRLAPQAQQNWTHRSSLEHTSLQAAAAPSTPSPTEGIDSDVSASKDERVEAVSRSSASDATRDAGTKVALGGTHLTAARDEEDRKKDGMVTEHEVGALEKLWVHDSDGRRLLFADVSVYTRNRCFRLLGSSKYGKTATLTIADSNERSLESMKWTGCGKRDAREVARTALRDSLVVPASADRPEGETFLTVGGQSGPHRYSRFGQTSGTSSRASLTSGNARRHQPGAGALGRGSGRVEACQRGNGDEGWRVTSSGFAASPFSAVDDFLRTLVCRGGVQGDLRQWSYAASESYAEVENKQDGRVISARRIRTVTRLLTHQVANNRWCCNIGRAHKSNHIFLVTDLSRGEVRQHCHDQDCRRIGYRSQPVRLPPAVAPSKDDLETYELELGLAAAMEESPKDWVHLA